MESTFAGTVVVREAARMAAHWLYSSSPRASQSGSSSQ
jgi:hypothetical protein